MFDHVFMASQAAGNMHRGGRQPVTHRETAASHCIAKQTHDASSVLVSAAGLWCRLRHPKAKDGPLERRGGRQRQQHSQTAV